MLFEQLNQFRQSLYRQLGKAKDAMFDLMDAVLVSSSIASFVSLSQSPVFRRQWPSIYAALQDGRIPYNKVHRGLVGQVSGEGQPILAGDRTVWPRPDAPTLREQTYEGGTAKHQQGHSYSTLAWVAEDSGSWVLPLRHERISRFETPAKRAAFQLSQVTRHLGVRPLAVYDRGYGNAPFVQQTAGIEADLLLRLASNPSQQHWFGQFF